MLYDTTADVIRKALRGLDMAPSQAAALCGLPEREVLSASRGPVSGEILETLAPALGLDGKALAGLPDYQPPSVDLDEIDRFELPFDDETVNAWMLDSSRVGNLLFDAGCSGSDELRWRLEGMGIRFLHALITHSHQDHAGGFEAIPHMLLSLKGPKTLQSGDQLRYDLLSVRVIALPGHCVGALGYLVDGLSVPVCVTGDALFAGSIGGCAPGEPYRQALESLRKEVMTLPEETLLLPGHGPATTVGSERKSNPFLARR